MVGVNVSEIGGVVMKFWAGGVTHLTLLVVPPSLSAVLHLVLHPARHLHRRHQDRRVTDHVLERRHAADSLAQVVSPVLHQLVAGTALVELILEVCLSSPEETEEHEESPQLDGTLHLQKTISKCLYFVYK